MCNSDYICCFFFLVRIWVFFRDERMSIGRSVVFGDGVTHMEQTADLWNHPVASISSYFHTHRTQDVRLWGLGACCCGRSQDGYERKGMEVHEHDGLPQFGWVSPCLFQISEDMKLCCCFFIESMSWEQLNINNSEDNMPCARAGHCSVGVSTRLYIWSGRDGYRKAWKNQVCCKDMWYLEVDRPAPPSRVSLVKAGTHSLEVNWNSSPSTQVYILQVMFLISGLNMDL